MIKSHRDLEVFQIAYHLSIDIHKTTEAFPKSELFGLTNQMRRASKGICANLAEGFMKQQFSKPEFKRYLAIAMGSSTEMQVWIDYARDLNYISAEKSQQWTDEYDTVSRMLQKFYRKL